MTELTKLVRPLEWDERSRGIWISGPYSVWHEWLGSGLYYLGFKEKGGKDRPIGQGYDSFEAAVAAANADHAARVVAALDAELLAEVVGALQYYASNAAWTVRQVEGPYGDYGGKARAVLAKLGAV